jgi:hypothetical protein
MTKKKPGTALAKSRPPPKPEAAWGKPGMAAAPPASNLRIPTQNDLMRHAMNGAKAQASVPAVAQIVTLARRMTALEDEIQILNDNLTVKNQQLTRLRMVDIPNAMSEAGTKYIELDSGEAVEVKDFVTGNIKEENREKAHAWLRAQGFGSLVKHVVSCAFGMGEDAKALTVVKWLASKKVPFEQKEAVNTGTLRAFVRERLEAGKALPPSIDYTSVPTASIKRPKPKE